MMNTGLCGDNWLATCKKCQEAVQECCIDVELTLFPDELKKFREKDPDNFVEYEDGTFGYEKEGRCCFLLDDNSCQLQEQGIIKPVDCMIYPINYKYGKIFIDTSCWALEFISTQDAIAFLRKKLDIFPVYKQIRYEIRGCDEFVMDLECE